MKLFKRKVQVSANDLFKVYSYREAFENGLVNTNYFEEYASTNWNIVKTELLLKVNSANEFKNISSTLFEKPWLELFITLANKHKAYYKRHFEENQDFYRKSLNDVIIEVMLLTNSTSEDDYINFFQNDIEKISENKNLVTRFWICRNYYQALKHAWPSFASEIFSSSKIEYNNYVNNDKNALTQIDTNYSDVFKRLTTKIGKKHLIDTFWHIVKVKGNSIDYSPWINNKECLLTILDECLKEEDENCIENIISIFYTAFTIPDKISEVNELKYKYINIVKNYNQKYVEDFNSTFKII